MTLLATDEIFDVTLATPSLNWERSAPSPSKNIHERILHILYTLGSVFPPAYLNQGGQPGLTFDKYKKMGGV